MKTEYFTRKQAAEILGLSVASIYRWEKAGLINPAIHITNRPRYTVESIQQALDKTTKKPRP